MIKLNEEQISEIKDCIIIYATEIENQHKEKLELIELIKEKELRISIIDKNIKDLKELNLSLNTGLEK